jgi:hypothetical protein
MLIPQAVAQLAEIEDTRKEGVLVPGHSRVGGGPDNERIVCGTLAQLQEQPPHVFGEPLHSLMIIDYRPAPIVLFPCAWHSIISIRSRPQGWRVKEDALAYGECNKPWILGLFTPKKNMHTLIKAYFHLQSERKHIY